MKRLLALTLTLIAFSLGLSAQVATWSFDANKLNDNEYELVFSAQIDPDYYMYSMDVPKGGPLPLVFTFEPSSTYELVGAMESISETKEEFDPIFEMDIKYYKYEAILKQKVKLLSGGVQNIKGVIDYQTCGNDECMPGEDDFSFIVDGGTAATALATPSNEEGTDESLILFFLLAFAAGLGGILTPCVFPMIPMTVSFFINGSNSRMQGIMKGIVFAASVTLIYTLIGVIVTLTKSSSFTDALSTSWIANGIFFILFLTFAISFFGVFEITLPSKFANKADQQADKGGYLASFFLALVLAIVSFSCTGPFVGAILVEATQGASVIKPIVGMFAFGLALSLPFVALSIFPALLKKLPKSGGWLNSVKIVFAFVMLAMSMKFLAVVDLVLYQKTGISFITRDVYLAIWIVLAILLGMYLLGKIKFSHDSDVPHISFFRLVLAITSFSFAVYMVPGLFGAPLTGISALIPAQDRQVFDLTKVQRQAAPAYQVQPGVVPQNGEAPKYADKFHLPDGIFGYFDLNEGIEAAKKQNKPILLDFKGHFCSNCKKMDKEVFVDPKVIDMINQNFVIIGLYIDDDTELPESEWITGVDGKVKKTIGKKNREYQTSKYKVQSQPYFVVIDTNENQMGKGIGYESSPEKFMNWAKTNLDLYKK